MLNQLEKLNHFEKLNIPATFQIDLETLEENYLQLQKQFHPDLASNETENEINSILINQAYKILKNPIKRAIYLLQLQNINIEDEQCSVKPSSEILMQIMEIREEIEESKNDSLKISVIKKEIKSIIDQEFLQTEKLLIIKEYSKAAQIMIRIKYLDKILTDLKMIVVN